MQKGKELEKLFNTQNNKYRKDKIAAIEFKETPIKLTNKGMLAMQSTVDFIGCFNNGMFIAFDAKDVSKKQVFTLSQLRQHQLIYLQTIRLMGGFAFLAIRFKEFYGNNVFIVPISFIEDYIFTNKRKSIPMKEFDEEWITTISSYLDKVIKMESLLKTPHSNFNITTWGF